MTNYTQSCNRPHGLESYRITETPVSAPIIDADSLQAAAARSARTPVIVA